MKLDPEALDVVSFPTGPADEIASTTAGPNRPTEPTPDTHCFVC